MNSTPTLQDVVRKFLPSYPYSLTSEQLQAMTAIRDCRSEEMGLSFRVCPNCGNTETHFRSCRNRHCPKCQRLEQELWLDAANAEIVDAPYFHVVFTTPHQLNELFQKNKTLLYSLLMRCSAQTLLELTRDLKYLGATPSVLEILHTWGADLKYHVHSHCLVSGGGLTDDDRFLVMDSVPGKDAFFIPVAVLKAKFKGMFLANLSKLLANNKLIVSKKFQRKPFLRDLYNQGSWSVHITETLNGKGNAIEYFSRYARRVAITDNRIKRISDHSVTFVAKDYQDAGKKKDVTLSGDQFLYRFSQHILPKRFQRVRRYGFINNRAKSQNLIRIARITQTVLKVPRFKDLSRAQVITAVWGEKAITCKQCGFVGIYFIDHRSRQYRDLCLSLSG